LEAPHVFLRAIYFFINLTLSHFFSFAISVDTVV
jgi:hypothetical protein